MYLLLKVLGMFFFAWQFINWYWVHWVPILFYSPKLSIIRQLPEGRSGRPQCRGAPAALYRRCGVLHGVNTFCADPLGGGNSNMFYFHPELWGRWTQFDSYFSEGLVQPPTSLQKRWVKCTMEVHCNINGTHRIISQDKILTVEDDVPFPKVG